jgi:heat shock protein HslJ/uncharacterized lipoprotein NlpE involved in copper resistance
MLRRAGSGFGRPGFQGGWGKLAWAAVVLLATAVAQEFKIAELTTFTGTLPCADCRGVRQVVSLRPDGFFYRQRSYLKTASSGQRVMDFGDWTVVGARLVVHSSLGETESFEILPDGALQLLDESGRRVRPPAQTAAASQPDYRLVREPRAYVPLGTYRLRGIYTQTRGRGRFQPCGSTVQFAVETTGRSKLLERLTAATAGGRAALLTASGVLEAPAVAGGAVGAGKEILRIASVMAAEPGGACGPAAVGPAAPRSALDAAGGAALIAVSLRGGVQKSQTESSAPLIDTPWVLIELANEPVAAGAGEREATIRFMTEGRVAGFSGCNRFNGSYTLEGRLLRLGSLAVTQMACADGAGVEAEYMKALEATRQFQIHRGTLDLLDAVGRNAARFRATLAR